MFLRFNQKITCQKNFDRYFHLKSAKELMAGQKYGFISQNTAYFIEENLKNLR